MSIVHAEHHTNYTVITNSIIEDKDLSLDAKMLLIFLLKKSKEWNVIHENLMGELDIGETILNRLIKQLLATGYMVRTRTRNKKGQLGAWDYVVYEIPVISESDREYKKNIRTKRGLRKQKKQGKQKVVVEDKKKKEGDDQLNDPSTEDQGVELPAGDYPRMDNVGLTSTNLETITDKDITDKDKNTNNKQEVEEDLNKSEAEILIEGLSDEFDSREREKLIKLITQVHISVAIEIIDEFSFKREKIKNPMGWIRAMIKKSKKGEFIPTFLAPPGTVTRDKAFKAREATRFQKATEDVLKRSLARVEGEVVDRASQFNDTVPGSFTDLMKGSY